MPPKITPKPYARSLLWGFTLAGSLILSQTSYTPKAAAAWPSKKTIKSWSQLPRVAKERLSLHPFNRDFVASSEHLWTQLFNNIRKGDLSFSQGMHLYLQEAVRSHAVSVHTNALKSTASSRQESLGLTFSVDGVSLCDYEAKAFKASDGTISLLGRVPQLDAHAEIPNPQDWPTWEAALTQAQASLEASLETPLEKSELISKAACYGVRDAHLLPLWELVLRHNGRSYRILADAAQSWDLQALFFEIADTTSATIQAYDRRPGDDLRTFMTLVTGDGTLTSSLFRTQTSGNGGADTQRAQSTEHAFVYPPEDARFAEASSFIHVTNMHQYFKSLGYAWEGDAPLILKLHAVLGGSKNNALYEPASATSNGLPSITIGDGDGKGLKNLPLDADVVSHEFGHHVVFRTLKNTVGESLILHEGLADYFAFAHSGDSCLGESICPEGSSICIVPSQCLRTAAIDLSYQDSNYVQMGAHQKSEVISGLLWNLREPMGAEKITKITYKSLDFLVKDSGFSDFLVSLLLADKELFASAHACTILAEADTKGLSNYTSGLDCEQPSTWKTPVLNANDKAAVITDTTTKDKDSDKGTSSCGSIAGQRGPSPPSQLSLLLLLLTPLCLMLCLKARKTKNLPN